MNVTRQVFAFGLAIAALAAPHAAAQSPVGTAFTYQGDLISNGLPISEPCDFEFRLFDAAVAGNQVGPTVALNAHPVSGGRFTAGLEFGAQFQGQARWLEISVRTSGGGGAFTTLLPRQELTPAPYAIGLSLPFSGVADTNLGPVFEIVNNDLGWAGVFRNSNPANTDAALNVTSMGGPAGLFYNDAGGTTLVSRNPGSGIAVQAEIQGTAANATAVYGAVHDAGAGAFSTAVRGANFGTGPSTIGVWGSSAAVGYGVYGTSVSGRGVFGDATDDFGFGVYGRGAGRSGVGVYGVHPHVSGNAPGVDGVTHSAESGAAGVRGRATSSQSNDEAITFGVLGTSLSRAGVGVRGESVTGVQGDGERIGVQGIASDIGGEGVRGEATYGVYGLGLDDGAGVVGEAGSNFATGVWAIGPGAAAPAIRAANQGGLAVQVSAGSETGIHIEEAWEYGIRAEIDLANPNGVAGYFRSEGTAIEADGRVEVNGTLSCNVLEIVGGADLAERFEFSEEAQPGMVVAIDPDKPGSLCVSRQAYNKRVAGVISGANDLGAGVVLGTAPADERNLPVAMSGRVWVLCDTRMRGVEPGDRLTTSDLPGYAMPVLDRELADDAIIGKAMTGLAQGESGMVLVLVNLQ